MILTTSTCLMILLEEMHFSSNYSVSNVLFLCPDPRDEKCFHLLWKACL